MKKRLCAALTAAILLLSGCAFPEKYPIEDVQNILLIGVDVIGDQIMLTAVVDKINQGSEPGKEQVGEQVYTAIGDTIFDAKRNLHTYSEKRTSWYHLKYILIGEEAAKQDLGTVLDFFCENDENRFLHRLLVARGMSASNFILSTVTHERNIAASLDSLINETKNSGMSGEIHLLDYASACESSSSIYIPTVQLQPATQHFPSITTETGDNPAYLTQLEGYALFRGNKLVGYLDGPESLWLNLAVNSLQSAAIVVTDNKGRPVSLEVVSSKAKIKVDTQGGLSATISIVMLYSFMVEYHETEGVLADDYIGYLEQQQSDYVTEGMNDTLAAAQRYGTDVFGFGEALRHKDSAYFDQIKDRWSEIFSTLQVTVEVQSKIQCTYSMINAAGN